ncbi:DNA helicase MCM9 isoform X2 [Gouania willdenowi]|uniref:DNA helicase MCM9 n=1 Tax=Gouania willdenowi TaxID=441366 RepID=A0A8C5EMB6_GOUWI|nr:DNA helicase MCM9 isoform X2 [Gouania willdenowi]
MIMLSPEQVTLIDRVFESYLTEHHGGDINQLIANGHEQTHHTVVVNAMTLFEANMEVGDYFNAYPDDVLAIFDQVLQRKANDLLDNMSLKHNGQDSSKKMRHAFHARITGLPVCPELTRDTIPRSRDVGHFLSVTGIVIRTSVAKVLEYERDYMCSKCGQVFTVQADFDQYYTFVPPMFCPISDGCNSCKFSCLSGGCQPASCRDYQEIKIQEQVQRLSVGSIPRTLVVVLEDDLVDSCKSGDDVTVYGVNSLRWRPFNDNTCCDMELVLKANNIEVNNSQNTAALLVKDVQKEFEDFWNSYKHNPIAGRNHILLSLCPQVFGMYVVKLAVALVLAGGVQRTDASGTRIRGECHMLLIGDPGTGKSQFLKYAAKIISRSVLTAGIGSTNAGLTVAAVKDGGDWHLEAGALVLSDGGLCCIDEFNSIKEHDRISIHEAMEQQSISVAKAGIVCKLNTRTSILAAANPKGHYNANEPLSVNVALASPLLSRFDLVLVLLDTRNAEWDSIISSFILEDKGLPSESSSLWSMEKMKAYFTVIKGLKPQVSEEANLILTRYFQLQRQSNGRNAARTTIRMLESLSRLAEAHARIMFRESVTIEDALTAVSVMECSMQGGALLGNVNTLLTSFPEEPDQQYQYQCQQLLTKLNLPMLLHKEMDRLGRLKSNVSEELLNGPSNTRIQNKVNDMTITLNEVTDIFHPDSSPPLLHDVCIRTSTPEKPNWKPASVQSDVSTITQKLSSQLSKDHSNNSTVNRDFSSRIINTNTSALEEQQQSTKNSENNQGKKITIQSNKLPSVRHETQPIISPPIDDQISSPPPPMVQNDGNHTKERSICAAIGVNMAAETESHSDLHAKLSGFMFKPRKIRGRGDNDDIPETKKNLKPNTKNTSKQDSRGDSVSSLTKILAKSRRCKTGQGASELDCITSLAMPRNTIKRNKTDQTENLSHVGEQTDVTKINTSIARISNASAPVKPIQISRAPMTTVVSAKTKLSRFAFPNEPATNETHERDLSKSIDSHSEIKGRLGSPWKSQVTESPNQSFTFKAKRKESVYMAGDQRVSVDAFAVHSPSREKKRKCFDQGSLTHGPAASSCIFSGLLSSTDLSHDAFDTDWGQEAFKKVI